LNGSTFGLKNFGGKQFSSGRFLRKNGANEAREKTEKDVREAEKRHTKSLNGACEKPEKSVIW